MKCQIKLDENKIPKIDQKIEFNKPNPWKMTDNLIKNFLIFKQEIKILFNITESESKKKSTQVTSNKYVGIQCWQLKQSVMVSENDSKSEKNSSAEISMFLCFCVYIKIETIPR